MKLRSAAVTLLVCALFLVVVKFKAPEVESASNLPVASKADRVLKSVQMRGLSHRRDRESKPRAEAGSQDDQDLPDPNVEFAEMRAATEDPGAPSLPVIDGLTSAEQRAIDDRVIAASSTLDRADDREIMREVHRVSMQVNISTARNPDLSLDLELPNP
jgi:hypothetical protein